MTAANHPQPHPTVATQSSPNLPSPNLPSTNLPSTNNSDPIETELLRQHTLLCARIDFAFAWLMLVQWIAAVGTALWVSPLTWAGDTSAIHPHVTSALLYGGVLTLGPVILTRLAPGDRLTRLTIAVTQMLMSSLLIHLSGGRIETHFHIFGSLAFLAFYLDWQVLAAASLVVLLDHTFRGLYLPFSAFGSHTVEPWRWLEHVGWVVFCDIFLIAGCQARLRGIREAAARHIERARLLHRAHYDPLTELPNRTLLSEKLATLTARPANTQQIIPFACLYIDLDYFKDINDRLGHSAGDQVLRLAAHRMQARLNQLKATPNSTPLSGQETAPFLARTGGDEFIAVIPSPAQPAETTQNNLAQDDPAEEAARALIHTLSQPFTLAGQEVSIGVSIGISHYPDHGADEESLLLSSDLAMYHVKRSGRNGFFNYNPALVSPTSEREQAERDLHLAILETQLEPYYQPIYRARPVPDSGPHSSHPQVANLELLLRWHHPTRGFIPPSHFIPLAEETGLIVELGAFVLRQAAIAAADWRHRGLLPGRIAVNVSSIQLAREDFAETVLNILDEHHTPPDAIEIEVTETALVNDFALAERHIRVLRAKGIRFAIDDFGTGYSSLSRLRQLTLDALKIDRVFVEAAVTSAADRTVIEHIIGMAHSLGMQVIAEGVETETQLQILRSLGCDLIQGYLYGQAAPKQETESLLHQHKTTPALTH